MGIELLIVTWSVYSILVSHSIKQTAQYIYVNQRQTSFVWD